jgi:hypothetical protein
MPTVETITAGPLGFTFMNVNKEMGLRGHSHYAQLTLVWRTEARVGFPAFDATYAAIKDTLREASREPFRDATNEEVARRLFALFRGWDHPVLSTWGGSRSDFWLTELKMGVQGTLDAIGHADGMTVYTVSDCERPATGLALEMQPAIRP